MSRGADRWDFAWASALSILTVLSRLPYRARLLYNWDAVQFALALNEYDVVKHQPHPPGYILYVGLGRIVNAFLHDEAGAYVLLAVVLSGLATFVVYMLALAVYDRTTAIAAAVLLAVSPLFWFYGSVGLTYVVEALVASVVAYFAGRALHRSETDAWLAAACLGLAGGLRPSIILVLLPLWLGSVVVGVGHIRTVVVGLFLIGGAALTWFVPMVWLTGGLDRYIAASLELAETVVIPTSILGGPIEVTLRVARYLLESVLVGLGPLAIAVFLAPWYVRRHGWGRREWFLLGWTVTPILTYVLVHFGQAGYVLTFLPAVVILLARILVTALGHAALVVRLPRARVALTAGAVLLVTLANGAFFVSARPLPRDFDAHKPAWKQTAEDEAFDWVFSRTAAALHEHEAVVRTLVEAIRGRFPADDTVVITELGNPRSYPWLRHAMFYLPGYTIYELRMGVPPVGYYAPRSASAMTPVRAREIRLPATAKRLVWFVDHWMPTATRPPGLREIELPYGRYLYVLDVEGRPIAYASYTLLPDEPPRRARAR
jgi:transmembrane protein TMEM260 (protein O-mannosyltransferase)